MKLLIRHCLNSLEEGDRLWIKEKVDEVISKKEEERTESDKRVIQENEQLEEYETEKLKCSEDQKAL